MNAVLAQRRAPGRILLLRTDDQTARFAYGSAPAFAAAFAEKLLEPDDADSAMTLGKAFRREYVESVGRR